MTGSVTNAPQRKGQGSVLFACTLGNSVSVTPAVHATFGLFLVPLATTFDWQRAQVSGVLGVLAVACAISYPLIGRFVDSHGARRTLLAGVVGLALSIGALGFTSGSLVQFYLTFAALALFAAMAGTPIFQKVVSDWFDENRGTALGISAGGGCGLGSVVMPVLSAVVVGALGWRAGYFAISAFMLLLAFPLLFLFLRDRGGAHSVHEESVAREGASLGEAARRPTFWLLLIAVAAGAGGTTAVFSHVVPILGDRGISVATGTAVVSVFALATSGWQIATGRIMDKILTPRVVVPMFGMAVAGLGLLEFGVGTPELILAGVLLGVGMGAQYGALPFFISRYFGVRHFGSIIGAMYSAVIAAQGLTPILLDLVFDTVHSYRPALIGVGSTFVVAMVLIMLLPRYDEAQAPCLDGLALPSH